MTQRQHLLKLLREKIKQLSNRSLKWMQKIPNRKSSNFFISYKSVLLKGTANVTGPFSFFGGKLNQL